MTNIIAFPAGVVVPEDPNARFRRIAHYRREIALLATSHRRAYHKYSPEIWAMFNRSLEVEPDGAGLPAILTAARELITQV